MPASVTHAVGERFPAPHRDALAVVLRNQPRDGRGVVEELDDDARIVERRAVIEHQRRDLAQRIVRVDRVLDRLHVDPFDFAVDALLGEDDAHFAREGAGRRGEEFHGGRRL
jgi:hypothetical protein